MTTPLTTLALAQLLAMTSAGGGGPAALQPLDAGSEDVTALSTSLRRVEPGLDPANAFSRVYRLGGEKGRLARVHGALYATFRRSVYARDGTGREVPVIPDGTVFHIGRPPQPSATPPRRAGGDRRIDGRLNLRIDPVPPQPAPRPRAVAPPPPVPGHGSASSPNLLSDAAYRAARLRELLDRAARAATSAPRRAGAHAARGRSPSSSK